MDAMAFAQPSTEQQLPIGGNTDVTSPAYQQAMVQQYGISTQPQYVQGQRNLSSDLAAKGIDNSGYAAAGEAGLEQSRQEQMGNEAATVGAGQAQQGFEKQQAATAQQYALDRMQQEQSNAMALQSAHQDFEQQQATMNAIGAGASGVGQIVGDAYGAGAVTPIMKQLMAQYANNPQADTTAPAPDDLPATDIPPPPSQYGAYGPGY